MIAVLRWLFFLFLLHQEALLFQYSGSQNKESHVTIFIWIFTNDLGAEKGELFWCLEGQNKELLRCRQNVRALSQTGLRANIETPGMECIQMHQHADTLLT